MSKKFIPEVCYQPEYKADRSLPEDLNSFEVFTSVAECKMWLENNGYDPDDFDIVDYYCEDIDDVCVINQYGQSV